MSEPIETVVPASAEERKAFWGARWAAGTPGWHRSVTSPELVEHFQRVAGDHAGRVLVPLCGMSLDLHWLAERADEVVGVELVEAAASGVFAARGLEASVEQTPIGPRYTAGGLSVVNADIMTATPAVLGRFDLIFDRAALVALPARDRKAYATVLAGLSRAGGRCLIVTFEYDQQAVHGPPHSVSRAEMFDLFDDCFKIEHIETVQATQLPQRFGDIGAKKCLWLLRKVGP